MQYQCYNGVNDICPSDINQGGCYKQSEVRQPKLTEVTGTIELELQDQLDIR